MKAQDMTYWDTKESQKRYANMAYELYDIERAFIFFVAEKLARPTGEIRILDLGCGGGRTTVPLLHFGFDVVGVDIAPSLIQSLQQKIGSERARVGDATNLESFSDQSFDIVLFSHNSLDCLYPYENRLKCLEEVRRVLKKDGHFIFSSHRFNPIFFNFHTFQNLYRNIRRWGSLFFSRGYYEEIIDGQRVELFSSSKEIFLRKELASNGFSFKRGSDYVILDNSNLKTFLKAIISWERYYVFQKK